MYTQLVTGNWTTLSSNNSWNYIREASDSNLGRDTGWMREISQFTQENDCVVPQLGNKCFLWNIFQLIIHLSSIRSYIYFLLKSSSINFLKKRIEMSFNFSIGLYYEHKLYNLFSFIYWNSHWRLFCLVSRFYIWISNCFAYVLRIFPQNEIKMSVVMPYKYRLHFMFAYTEMLTFLLDASYPPQGNFRFFTDDIQKNQYEP